MALPARAILLALLVVGVPLLAGCLGQDPAPTDEAELNASTSDLPLALPDNRSGEFSAFKETNVTSGGSHNHDLWNGRARIDLFTKRAEMQISEEGAATRIPMEPNTVVLEQTAAIEVLVSNPQRHACEPFFVLDGRLICTDSGHLGVPPQSAPDPAPSQSLRLFFLHAASDPDDWQDAGPLVWDTPLSIALKDPTWTDMPHSSGSLWAFRVVSTDPADQTLVFDLSVSILRATGVVPMWPGHPDFYAEGKHYRLIYDGQATTEDGGGNVEVSNIPAKLISWGTKTVSIFVNVTDVQATVSKPTHVYMYFHNASWTTWNATSPFNDTYMLEKGPTYQFNIRMDPNGMDSPYATLSRWEFILRGSYNTPVIACIDGCLDYKLTYDIKIVATDLEAPWYSETRPA